MMQVENDIDLVKEMKVDRKRQGRISAADAMPDKNFDSITNQISLGVKDSVPGVSSEEEAKLLQRQSGENQLNSGQILIMHGEGSSGVIDEGHAKRTSS